MRRLALIGTILAAAGCGNSGVTPSTPTTGPLPTAGTVTAVVTDPLAGPFDTAVGDVVAAMAGFGDALGRVKGEHLKRSAADFAAAEQSFAAAVAAVEALPPPPAVATTKDPLVASWRALDEAMREVARAAKKADQDAFLKADDAFLKAVEAVQTASDAYQTAIAGA